MRDLTHALIRSIAARGPLPMGHSLQVWVFEARHSTAKFSHATADLLVFDTDLSAAAVADQAGVSTKIFKRFELSGAAGAANDLYCYGIGGAFQHVAFS